MFLTPTPNVLDDSTPIRRERSVNFDDLTSSPLHVEPYPARVPANPPQSPLDSPAQRRVEGVYDRFLMATSGVKRAGKGYCSDNRGPVSSAPNTFAMRKRSSRTFHSAGRRGMPPPVSSDDTRMSLSVDELGVMSTPNYTYKDDGNHTVAFVRRAIKAMTAKTASRRLSRTVMA